jgi:hypothetical protein
MRAIYLQVIIIVGVASAQAQQPANHIESLKGLTDVRVIIDGLSKEAEAAGLQKADIQAQIEKSLKSAGLRILAASERARGNPTLHLSMIAFPASKQSDELFVYSIELSLSQEVRLSRSPAVRVQSPTWRPTGAIGTTPKTELPKLKITVDEFLKNFVNDVSTANK